MKFNYGLYVGVIWFELLVGYSLLVCMMFCMSEEVGLKCIYINSSVRYIFVDLVE